MKIGSLFDGSGGFPLAASLCGIEPVWASEVEPYPIAVTRSRFPGMKHLGDISKINGAEIEPTEIVSFGSPCQDLSVAGRRAGLKHTENGDDETTRSGLFMEAVRIIKEMREATHGKYPRFAVWENVPGAFSSNKGQDFRTVLEELIKIVEPTAVMPEVPKGGWAYADSFCGNGWSLAWRVLDAQYIRTAQRRRRVYLVLDLRGQCARKVLFERESLRGYSAESGASWKETARDAGNGAEVHDRTSGVKPVCFGIGGFNSEGMLSSNPHAGIYEAETSRTLDLNGGNPACNQGGIAVVEAVGFDGYNSCDTGDKAAILGVNCGMNTGRNGVLILDDLVDIVSAGFKANQGAKAGGIGWQEEQACTLNADRPGLEPSVCVKCYESHPMDSRIKELGDVSPTVSVKWHKGAADTPLVCQQYLFENHSQDARYRGPLEVCPMLSAQMGTGGNNQPLVLCMATQQGGAEIMENLCPTITASAGMSGNNQPVLCMAHGQANAEILEDKSPCLNCNHEQPIACFQNTGVGWWNESDVGATIRTPCGGDATLANVVVEGECAGVDCRNLTEHPELYPTLQAKPNGGQSLNYSGAVRTKYIVRRLTPTECARLQGFPDRWGHPDPKEDFTDEEYRFWLDVRNTHAAINGKPVKDYTPKQMLTWYNKLHTDSAEYKMWGNGIALPCALYVMQGIQDALEVDNGSVA